MELFTFICGMAVCGWEIDTWHEVASQYPLCRTEDSVDCTWRADVQGDGFGRSFVALDQGDTVTLYYQPIDGEIEIVTYSTGDPA